MPAPAGMFVNNLARLIAKFEADKAQRDQMVGLVERMLELNKRREGLGPAATGKQTGAQRAPLPAAPERLEREIAATDREIDEFVYELYGITDEERKTIESV